MGKCILARWRRSADRRKRTAVQRQAITQIVQTQRVGQLPIAQRHHVAPWRKGARSPINFGLPRQAPHQMGRNELAELPQHRKTAAGWFGLRFGFHTLSRDRFKPSKPTHFFPAYGTAVIKITKRGPDRERHLDRPARAVTLPASSRVK